jgi:hypothetical protein
MSDYQRGAAAQSVEEIIFALISEENRKAKLAETRAGIRFALTFFYSCVLVALIQIVSVADLPDPQRSGLVVILIVKLVGLLVVRADTWVAPPALPRSRSQTPG